MSGVDVREGEIVASEDCRERVCVAEACRTAETLWRQQRRSLECPVTNKTRLHFS